MSVAPRQSARWQWLPASGRAGFRNDGASRLHDRLRRLGQQWRRGAVLLALMIACSVQAETMKPHILILNSYHAGYSWSDGELLGVLRVISKNHPGAIPSVEFLDAKRDPSPERMLHLLPFIQEKYRGQPFDLIITLDDAALAFALRHRAALGPDVPVIFGGVNNYRPELLAGHSKVTGVAEAFDFAGNLDLILQLRPATKSVVLIYDSSEATVDTRKAFEQVAPRYTNRVAFKELAGWTAEELIPQLASLPADATGLILGDARDASGRLVSEDVDFLQAMAARSSVPAFMLSQPFLPVSYGYGWDRAVWYGVGGSMLSSDAHGESVGAMASRVLKGEPVEAIPVMRTGTPRLAFDYSQLVRHRINPDLLPAHTEFYNRQASFYEQYKTRILLTLGIIALLCAAVVVLAVNIARRYKAEQALRESNERFQLVARATNDAVWDLDFPSGAVWWNDRFVEMFQLPPDVPQSRRVWEEVIHPDDRARVLARAFPSAPEAATVLNLEHRFVRRDGSAGHALLRAYFLRDAGGRPVRAVGSMLDITERKHNEEELRRKNEELERFTYTVSHDLKSPLITIKGFTGALQQDLAAGRHERLDSDLKRIGNATDKMTELLNDLLELSRIGRVMNPPAEVSLGALVQEALELLAGPVQESGAQIVVPPGLPAVFGDHRRLIEVFQNLIENSLRFRGGQPHPRIEIGMRLQDGGRVFFVSDNGMGIEPRFHESVFGLFNKLDSKTPGTGIGLALVRRIIEVHGGKIWVESEGLNRGSTFCFTLAAPPTAKKEKQS